jgi:hypothetical protein
MYPTALVHLKRKLIMNHTDIRLGQAPNMAA